MSDVASSPEKDAPDYARFGALVSGGLEETNPDDADDCQILVRLMVTWAAECGTAPIPPGSDQGPR